MKTLIVNLLGGPGIGKTTEASTIFGRLKKMGISAEYIQEYVKYKVWEENYDKLKDQILVFGKQHNRMFVVKGKVRVVINDSALLNSIVYNSINNKIISDAFENLVIKTIYEDDEIENLDILLKRTVPYQKEGRYQTLEEAIEVDIKVKDVLEKYDIKHIEMNPMNKIEEDAIVSLIIQKIKQFEKEEQK